MSDDRATLRPCTKNWPMHWTPEPPPGRGQRTCLLTSKDQIRQGRFGRSRARLSNRALMTTTPIASWIAMLVGPSNWQLRSTGGLSSAASSGIAADVLAAGRAALYDVEATEALIAARARPLRGLDATHNVGRWERRIKRVLARAALTGCHDGRGQSSGSASCVFAQARRASSRHCQVRSALRKLKGKYNSACTKCGETAITRRRSVELEPRRSPSPCAQSRACRPLRTGQIRVGGAWTHWANTGRMSTRPT